jgi:putative endopeptidase
MKKIFAALSVCGLIYGCNSNETKTVETAKEKVDVLASHIDSTVAPGEDFFLYANGGWIKQNPIPAEQSSWSIGHLVIEENLRRLKEISEKAAANKNSGEADKKIGDFWSTAMDSVKINADGLKPIQPLLDKINAITDVNGLVKVVAELKKSGSHTLFAEYIGQDAKKSDVMAYNLWQGGLSLPEREYYFKADSSTVNIRNAYVAHIAKMLVMAGEDTAVAATAAKNILKLETNLAKASRKIEDLRDPYKNYNKMAISDLPKMAANINWSNYLTDMGVKSVDSVIVGQPEFYKALNTALLATPIADWKQYVKYNLLQDMSGVLPDAYGEAAFDFNKLFSGAKQRKPRWKRVVQMEEDAMGEMLGKLYVEEFFNATAKKRYTVMVDAIKEALRDRISKLTWMGDSTKQKAYAKLASMKSKVGYPDKWKDFSAMQIGTESLAKNYMNARLFWHNYEYNKLGKPVDRDEWVMTPQTYNAYYNPSNNEIVMPAGIFTVPGYRDEELDDATVYGYAGASTIGHEITHGFDDEGRQFDAEGNLKSWWTSTDETAFTKRADVMVKQFNEYEPIKGYHINGKATLGENIADLGGILLGIEAFKKTAQYKENKSVAGLTPMQRYFLGYALGWLGHTREEQLRNRLLTDVHSPAQYRVNGPFVDVDEFYTTFGIKAGDKMYRPDSLRVRIW